jgi:hypothetical protein
MKIEYFPHNQQSLTKAIGCSLILTQLSLFLQGLFIQLFGVFSNLKKILKALAIKGFRGILFFIFNSFNYSVIWLNQLILDCVSVFVLREAFQILQLSANSLESLFTGIAAVACKSNLVSAIQGGAESV